MHSTPPQIRNARSGFFLGCRRTRRRVVRQRWHGIGAYASRPQYHARSACEGQGLRPSKWVRAKVRITSQRQKLCTAAEFFALCEAGALLGNRRAARRGLRASLLTSKLDMWLTKINRCYYYVCEQRTAPSAHQKAAVQNP